MSSPAIGAGDSCATGNVSGDDDSDIGDAGAGNAVDAKYDKIKSVLIREKYLEHRSGDPSIQEVKGTTTQANGLQNVVRLSKMFYWIYFHLNARKLDDSCQVLMFIKAVFDKHYVCIKSYCEYLMRPPKSRKAGTIVVLLHNISSLLTWFAVWFDTEGRKYLMLRDSAVTKCRYVIKELIKIYRASIQRGKTLEEAIDNNNLPTGGLRQLQGLVNKSIIMIMTTDTESEKTYNVVLRTLIALFYVFGVQGRIGGFSNLTLEHGLQLVREGLTLSTKFKTKSKYLAQPITLPNEKLSFLSIYITKWRSWALSRRPSADPCNALFLNSNGKPAIQLGACFTKFFLHAANLQITTSWMRTLYETGLSDANRNGLISAAELSAAQNVNGHSSRTVKEHYIMGTRKHDGQVSKAMMARLTNEQPYLERPFAHMSRGLGEYQHLCDPQASATELGQSSMKRPFGEMSEEFADVRNRLDSSRQQCGQISDRQYQQLSQQQHLSTRRYNASSQQQQPTFGQTSGGGFDLQPYSSFTEQSSLEQPSEQKLLGSFRGPQHQHQHQHSSNLLLSSHEMLFNPNFSMAKSNHAISWGHARADINETQTRYAWLDEEKDIIGSFCLNELKKYKPSSAEYIEVSKTLVSRCLDYIKGAGSKEAAAFFHPHHIAKSDRLKAGYEATRKMSCYSSLPEK